MSARTLLLAGAGAAALGLACLGVIALVTRDGGPGERAVAPAAAAPVAQPAEVVRSIPPAPPAAAPPPGRPAVTTGVAHPSPGDPPRPLLLKPSRQTYDLLAGLGALQAQIDHCADGAPPAALGDRSRGILWLEMETLSGRVRITDAQLDRQGGASMELVSCALDVLRGKELRMRVAKPGSRVRMQYPLGFAYRPPPAG